MVKLSQLWLSSTIYIVTYHWRLQLRERIYQALLAPSGSVALAPLLIAAPCHPKGPKDIDVVHLSPHPKGKCASEP